jgi:hypothetical protein
MRYQGRSPEEIAEHLRFNSVEEVCAQLESWKLPEWLVGEGSQTDRTNNKVRKESARRARGFGPAKELPPAGNATPLFRERLEALLESAEHLKHMDEDLHGRYFVRTNIDTTPVFFPREHLPKEVWEAVCEQYELDPDDEGFLDTNTHNKFPGGAATSPSEIEATLISMYALAGGRMDVLLHALHPDSPPVGAKTWEEIRQCIEGSKADGDKRDGLKVLARHLATWVRGSEVRSGRPAGLSEMEHGLACRITHHRKDGLTDEAIVDKLSHYKKEDGTSYSMKDVAELGDLGLSWS